MDFLGIPGTALIVKHTYLVVKKRLGGDVFLPNDLVSGGVVGSGVAQQSMQANDDSKLSSGGTVFEVCMLPDQFGLKVQKLRDTFSDC